MAISFSSTSEYINFCQCGCGQKCKNKYVFNHHRKGTKQPVSQKTKDKMRKAALGNKRCLGYHHTQETKEKMSKAKKGKPNHQLGTKLSDETKSKISNSLKIMHQEHPEIGLKISESEKLFYQTHPEVKEQISLSLKKHYEKHPETREKISKSRKKYINEHPGMYEEIFRNSGKKRFKYECGDIVIMMRSNWEVKYAKYLDSQKIKWEYEPKCFRLSNGKLLFLDFYLPELNEWHEVKGYISKIAKEKLGLFREEYKDVVMKLLTKIELKKLGVI